MEKGGDGPTTPSKRPPLPAKKRGGSMSFIRAVMLAFGGNSSKKTPVSANVIVDASTADTVIKTIIGGMRPLHHQLDYKSPPPPPPSMALDSYYDVHLPPPSPCSSDSMSRYASAEDLQSLDTSEGNEEEISNNGEPNAIDMRAEEFITMFYIQMKLQRSESLKTIEEEATSLQRSDSLKMIDEEATSLQRSDPLKMIGEEATSLQQSDLLKTIEEETTIDETAC